MEVAKKSEVDGREGERAEGREGGRGEVEEAGVYSSTMHTYTCGDFAGVCRCVCVCVFTGDRFGLLEWKYRQGAVLEIIYLHFHAQSFVQHALIQTNSKQIKE